MVSSDHWAGAFRGAQHHSSKASLSGVAFPEIAISAASSFCAILTRVTKVPVLDVRGAGDVPMFA